MFTTVVPAFRIAPDNILGAQYAEQINDTASYNTTCNW